MPHIVIISSSVRKGRNSHRTALFFQNFITSNAVASVEILDLKNYDFPIFEERLRFFENPTMLMLEFASKVKNADGVIIVTPEYNGGYPSSLKNVVDLLYDEWRKKPVAIATNSAGPFGGTQVITSLQFSLWKIGAWTVPAMFPVPKVQEAFDENGVPADEAGTHKRATIFINELLWCMEAKKRME
ncbi:NAD(P)H-dependent FMN reductase [Pedobacter africanus]|uniref:NAD(P)H-dependent FMN reductase n=1 Tax=Pedobacter africanus TaxID=151894 RepID=A0ACC6KSB0_9SPHI|nr:NAD(P)H-dependent oxidoreductase [Pedobacter africanus]MDR6782040.1 NAD(P)H-dependent FMN reductase [Pedobacter africanus]